MSRAAATAGLIQGAITAAFLAGLARGWFPLGVPGEWEWLRLPASARLDPTTLLVAGLVVAGLAGLAALGARALVRPGSRLREAAWVGALAGASVLAQMVVQEGAPSGYGLAKWVLALQNPGSSGYATVARDAMPGGLARFLRDYPDWIQHQDSLHIGTHPPGLFAVARATLDLTRARPDLARWLVDHAPGSAAAAARASRDSGITDRPGAAALLLTGALTLLGSALTVVPLYLLARAGGSAAEAWGAAALWPLLPAALLFQPAADAAFPLLSTSALALAAWAARSPGLGRGIALAAGAGVVLAVGMEFTLAFLAVGLLVAVVLMLAPGPSGWRGRVGLIGATGLGFVLATAAWWGATGADPVAVWWSNQAHHAGFYREYPRSRLAWTAANAAESAVAVGLVSVVWMVAACRRPRAVPAAAWGAAAVLLLLTASGRSLSEVGRLWLPMFPPLLLASSAGWGRSGAGPAGLAATVGLLGVQALAMQALIQVVYPV